MRPKQQKPIAQDGRKLRIREPPIKEGGAR